MADKFELDFDRVFAPSTDAVAVTPNDVVPLNLIPKAVYIGTGGDLTVCGSKEGATDVTFKNVPDGAVLPFRAKFIRATGTTATDIVVLY